MKLFKLKIFCGWLFLLLTFSIDAKGQVIDTLKLNPEQAEKLFIDNNFLLLAQKYKVNADEALIRQARLWNNPSLYLEKNVYNPQSHKIFEAGPNSENIIQLQQIIQIAGKRGNQIKLAMAQSMMTQDVFNEVMLSLHYQLMTTLNTLYFQQNSLSVYDDELGTLGNLVEAFETQYDKGNISLKEVVRLRALAFSLQNERLDIITKISDLESTLNTLLQPKQFVYYRPWIDENAFDKYNPQNLLFASLLQTALDNRPDIKMQEDNLQYAKTNLVLQKSSVFPDLTIGANFDLHGGVYPDYNGVGIGLTLPILNRNQGNIRSAGFLVQSQQAISDNYRSIVQHDVMNAYTKAVAIDGQYRKMDKKFSSDFSQLVDAIQENYTRKNMSLLEFIDFFQTYKESMLQVNEVKNNRLNSFEDLNLAVGKNVFVVK